MKSRGSTSGTARIGALASVVWLVACASGKQLPLPPDLAVQVDASPCDACTVGEVCSPQAGTCACDPARCPGCCDSAGRCVLGTKSTACGNGGVACVDCSALNTHCDKRRCAACTPACAGKVCGPDACGASCGPGCFPNETCVDGACVCQPSCKGKCKGAADGCGSTCQTSDCAGCCDGLVCREGTDPSLCGSAGASCRDCTQGLAVCQAGTCEAGQCALGPATAGTPCAQGRCFEGSCCSGCWNGVDCFPGTDDRVCGAKGEACLACNDGNPCTEDRCVGGSCMAKDAPPGAVCPDGVCAGGECCRGCIEGGACKAGIYDTACGSTGVACQSCGAGETCFDGRCVTGPIKPTGCEVRGAAGCEACACEACVCAQSPFCCTKEWDLGCAMLCTKCETKNGCQASPSGCGGCGGASCQCQTCACAIDPFCCDGRWDTACAQLCVQSCRGTCS